MSIADNFSSFLYRFKTRSGLRIRLIPVENILLIGEKEGLQVTKNVVLLKYTRIEGCNGESDRHSQDKTMRPL